MTEVMQRSSVQKLKGLLQDRYGMGLQIVSMISAADVDVEHIRSERRGSSLHVPVCARGKYLATALLTKAESLSEGDISAVSEMVRLVLEPALFSVYLDRQEWNRRASQAEVQAKADVNRNSSLILLESFNPHTVSRVAVHIHESGDRWALLNYNQVRKSITSLKDLREMGPMTLLVEDLLLLSPEEQTRFAEFARNSDPKTEPLILIGCTTSLNDLLQREMVVAELADLVHDSRLELDRMPKEFSQLRESVELALDRHAHLGNTLS